MHSIYATLALAVLSSVQAIPLERRINQDTPSSLAKWEQACLAAGGGQQCNPVKVKAFGTLLAGAAPCDQQDNADIMINLAKKLNNDPEMIRLTRIFTQQPRNSPNSVSVVYCDKAPQNAELNGLFQCQFQGVNDNLFTNGNTPGQAGTIPFGLSSPVSPPGSCPAHADGKIPDGQQLVDIVQDAGTPSAGDNNDDNNDDGNNDDGGDGSDESSTQAPPATDSGAATQTASSSTASSPAVSSSAASSPAASSPSASSPAAAAATPTSTGSGFQADNARQAQQLNKKFASLTSTSSCKDGEQACVQGGFAQCVGGKFQVTPCSAGTQCFALPLVNKPGTSVTCDTASDAADRISRVGVSGGVDGQS